MYLGCQMHCYIIFVTANPVGGPRVLLNSISPTGLFTPTPSTTWTMTFDQAVSWTILALCFLSSRSYLPLTHLPPTYLPFHLPLPSTILVLIFIKPKCNFFAVIASPHHYSLNLPFHVHYHFPNPTHSLG